MYAVAFVLIIAAWAIWVAYQATQDHDYKQEAKVDIDPHWPFPTSNRP